MTYEQQDVEGLFHSYCNNLGIWPHPLLAWSKEELYNKFGLKPDTWSSDWSFGIWFEQYNVIFINLIKHQNLNMLIDTIRHELVHCRFPNVRHYTKEFYKIMKQLKNGKTWKTSDRLPNYTRNVISHKISKLFR